jgi:hypothetical protein
MPEVLGKHLGTELLLVPDEERPAVGRPLDQPVWLGEDEVIKFPVVSSSKPPVKKL